jgi:SAM-dependent methyltransferase
MDLVGIDQKPVSVKHPRHRQGDVMREDLFPSESFDQIVSLSAIEHIGLGHYGDPKDPDGDTKAVANCIRWLKPGGWLYLDVPYDPTGYRVQTTECRVYDDAALKSRLLPDPAWVGYSASDSPGTLIPKPARPHRRFWYVAMMWQKPKGLPNASV